MKSVWGRKINKKYDDPYPSWWVGVYMGKGRGSAWDTHGLPLPIPRYTLTVSLHALRNWGSGVSLRVTQVKFWSNFDIFWFFLWHPGQSWRKHCKSCNTLQHGLKIGIYCCKILFFLALWAGPPSLPRVMEQHPGSPLCHTKFGERCPSISLHAPGQHKMCKIFFRIGLGRGPATSKSKLLRLCTQERMS